MEKRKDSIWRGWSSPYQVEDAFSIDVQVETPMEVRALYELDPLAPTIERMLLLTSNPAVHHSVRDQCNHC